MALDFPSDPVDGQIYEQFFWDESSGIWRNRQVIAVLNSLGDVNASDPNDEDILVYNGQEGGWKTAPQKETPPFEGIQGISVSGPEDGENLFYQSGSWVNGFPPFLETSVKTSAYTLTLADAGKIVPMNASSVVDVTVPNNNVAPFPIGTIIGIYNMSSSNVNVVPGGGVTVRSSGLILTHNEVSIRKRAANEWVMVGGL